MATKRLGKGLEALIRSNSTQTKETSKLSNVSNILISKIKTNPLQPRKEFKKDSLEDLASSIKENGVISPITCLLYTSPSPRDRQKSRMPSSA